jgi:hypothetical protein
MIFDVDAIDWWEIRQQAKAAMRRDQHPFEQALWEQVVWRLGAPHDLQPKKCETRNF